MHFSVYHHTSVFILINKIYYTFSFTKVSAQGSLIYPRTERRKTPCLRTLSPLKKNTHTHPPMDLSNAHTFFNLPVQVLSEEFKPV